MQVLMYFIHKNVFLCLHFSMFSYFLTNYFIFFQKYLYISKKSSNFAAETNEGARKGSLNFVKMA